MYKAMVWKGFDLQVCMQQYASSLLCACMHACCVFWCYPCVAYRSAGNHLLVAQDADMFGEHVANPAP